MKIPIFKVNMGIFHLAMLVDPPFKPFQDTSTLGVHFSTAAGKPKIDRLELIAALIRWSTGELAPSLEEEVSSQSAAKIAHPKSSKNLL